MFSIILLFFLIFNYLQRLYNFYKIYKKLPVKNMTVLITDPFSMSSKSCIYQLLEKGCNIILAHHNYQKYENKSDGRIKCMYLDLCSKYSIQKFIDNYPDNNKIDVLICNKEIYNENKQLNHEEIELTFGINYLANYQLITGLLSKNLFNENSRILLLNSNAHIYAANKNDIYDSLTTFAGYQELIKPVFNDPWKCYVNSMVYNMIFVNAFSKRYSFPKINSVSIGFVPENKVFFSKFYNSILSLPIIRFLSKYIRTPQEAGLSLSNLVLNDDYKDISGKYFYLYNDISSNEYINDSLLEKNLLKISRHLNKIE